MKIYVKRNMNELGELAFKERCSCPDVIANTFAYWLAYYKDDKGTRWYDFKVNVKTYLGEYTEEEFRLALDTLAESGRRMLMDYLEIEE